MKIEINLIGADEAIEKLERILALKEKIETNIIIPNIITEIFVEQYKQLKKEEKIII